MITNCKNRILHLKSFYYYNMSKPMVINEINKMLVYIFLTRALLLLLFNCFISMFLVV